MHARVLLGPILLALVPALAACGDDTAALAEGDIVQAREDDQFASGRSSSVTLPVGRLLISVEEPVETAGADATRSREPVEAPAASSLVPITWQWDTWGSDRLDGIVATRDTPRVDLVTGGESYRLPPPQADDEAGESFYVVVAGDAEDRSLEIDFDGEMQTVDLVTGDRDEGRAAALYSIDDDRLRKKACDDEPWFDTETVSAEFSCDLIGPVLTPYAAGEWAPEGSVWLAVTLTTQLRAYGEANLVGGGARYLARRVHVAAEIDGAEPDVELSVDNEADVCPHPTTRSCGWSRHLVFEVPEDDGEQGPLDIEVTYRLSLAAQWGDWDPPERTQATAEETFKIWKD